MLLKDLLALLGDNQSINLSLNCKVFFEGKVSEYGRDDYLNLKVDSIYTWVETYSWDAYETNIAVMDIDCVEEE